MASHSRSISIMDRSTSVAANGREKSHFEQQREALIGEIAMSFEHVLANINKLNRSLEAVVAVGSELASVEALWSQFENVMAKDEDTKGAAAGDEQEQEQEQEQNQDQDRGHDQEQEQEQEDIGERSTTPKGEPAT
ncbi:DASH complex subunit Dad1-domain-containing protein [Xylaria arbuscula]|nr:DASH complex subunit Dad1-domain-containing protein [Xylaria arbuscula]